MHLKRWAATAGAATFAGLAIEAATRSGGYASRHGVRLGRLMWWPPWAVSDPLRPHIERSADENCNPSVLTVIPALGAVTVFYGRRWRTDADGICDRCLVELSEDGTYTYDGAGVWTRVTKEVTPCPPPTSGPTDPAGPSAAPSTGSSVTDAEAPRALRNGSS